MKISLEKTEKGRSNTKKRDVTEWKCGGCLDYVQSLDTVLSGCI